MENLKYLILVLSLLSFFDVVISDPSISKFQKCNPKESTIEKSGCPELSSCIDNGTAESFCVCSSEYTVNDDFKFGATTYCVKKIEAPKATNSSTTTAKTVSNSQMNSPSTTVQATIEQSSYATTLIKIFDDVKVAPVPSQQNIWGIIFYSIFVVFGFLGIVFAIRKYNLIGRARGLLRSRSQHQNYNGLMENEFDDDDPLLI